MENKTIRTLIIMHIIDDETYEIMDMQFPEINIEEEKPEDAMYFDAIMNMAKEDAGEYGDISNEIHDELWNEESYERYYCVNIDIKYTTRYNKIDNTFETDFDYEYELSDIEKEWSNLNLLQKGDKIYYIDYEESNASYTIEGISEVNNHLYKEGGYWYEVHSDLLPSATGYYSIPVLSVDSNDIKDRFFSTPELAHEGYERFKEWVKQKNNIDNER